MLAITRAMIAKPDLIMLDEPRRRARAAGRQRDQGALLFGVSQGVGL
jgi:ABC-type molybdenum transport system ATPase subunit/photorepair protein PhrA